MVLARCEPLKTHKSPERLTLGGGAREDRTPDLLRARQALSQLSYGPIEGFALDFSSASLFVRWWVWEDLNLRPHPYQGCALTN